MEAKGPTGHIEYNGRGNFKIGKVCGYVGVWVCGCVGMWVCGYVGVWVCGCVGMWVCGHGMWVRGLNEVS